jgi:hypothetical protein
VVNPSVSRAYGLQGTALTVFVDPSALTTSRPGPVSTRGSAAGEYTSPLGRGSVALGVEADGADCVVEGSDIGGGPGSGGGWSIVSPVVPAGCWAMAADDNSASESMTENKLIALETPLET